MVAHMRCLCAARRLQKRLSKRGRTLGELFHAADTNRDNKLNFDEFCKGVTMMGIRPMPPITEMRALFDVWDIDNDGWLEWHELQRVLGQLDRKSKTSHS